MNVLFLNRSYGPDSEATGQLLTELCEDLAPLLDVTVIVGQPTHGPNHCKSRTHGTEMHQRVRIIRVWHTQFPKQSLLGRLINYVSFLIGAFCVAFWTRRPDIVIAETDPPLLCLIGWCLQRVRRAKLVCYLQDIHPDIGIALGKLRDCWPLHVLRRLLFRIYRGADRVVVLSSDMRDRVAQSGVDPRQIVCLPNWIDTAKIRPVKANNPFRRRHGIEGRFIAMYSGNLGFCQRLEDVISAACVLRDRTDIMFLLVGGGVLKRRLQDQVARLGLKNVRFLPSQPAAELAASLSAADVHLVPLDERVAACLMPSKFYGVLASESPLIAVAPRDCELAQLTLEHGVGVVTPPGDPRALAAVIENLADRAGDLPEMGRRARRLAESCYDRRYAAIRFHALLRSVLDATPPAKPKTSAAPRFPEITRQCESRSPVARESQRRLQQR